MSFRTVTRFVMVGLLGMSIAAPAAAQDPIRVRVVETRTGSFLFSGSFNTDGPTEVAPMPRAGAPRLNVPPLGPIGTAIDFAWPLNQGSVDKRSLVIVSRGVFESMEPEVEVAPMPRVAERHGEFSLELSFGGPEVIQLKFEHRVYGEAPEVAPMPRVVPAVGPCAEEEVFQLERVVPPAPPAPVARQISEVEYGIEVGSGPVLFRQYGDRPCPAAAMPRQVQVQGPGELFIEEVIPGTVVGRPAMRVAVPGCCNEGNYCVPLNGGPAPAPHRAAAAPGFFFLDDCDSPFARGSREHGQMTAHNPMIALGKFRRDDNGTWWAEVIRVPQPKFTPASQPQFYYIERAIAQTPAPAKPACCAEKGAAIGACIGSATGTTVGMHGPTAACCEKSCPLAGTWVREVDGTVIAATLSPCGGELKLCLTQNAEGHTVCLTVTADCKVTRDGLVHGALTGIDLDMKPDPKAAGESPFGTELAEMSLKLHEFIDAPFSFRARQTSAGLMVSNLKMGPIGPGSIQELAILCGMFKPCKEGAVPAPKPMKVRQSWQGGMTLPSAQYLQHPPAYFSTEYSSSPPPYQPGDLVVAPAPRACPAPTGCGAPPMTAPPLPANSTQGLCPASGPCPAPVPCPTVGYGFAVPVANAPTYSRGAPPQSGWNPTKPANVPPSEFGMMADAFNQMLGCGQAGPCLPPAPAPVGMPHPAVVQPLGFTLAQAPPPPVQPLGFTMPPMLAQSAPCPLPAAARPSITGTWVREVGPLVYVVKIAPDHLTVTATAATEIEDGKTMTEAMILAADYHLTRDGTTLVGLITGLDTTIDGDLPDMHLPEMQEELARLQKAYTDKPFAMSVRVYGDALVIGNVRLPHVDESRDEQMPLCILGGRYRNATDKPLPRPRAMKPPAPQALPPGVPVDLPYGPPAGEPVPFPPPPGAPVSFPPPRPAGGRLLPPCPQDAPRCSAPPTAVCPAPAYVPRELNAAPADDRIPPPAPRASQPAPPPMAVPAPPAVEEPKAKKKKKKEAAQPERIHGGILLNEYSSDPNVRMQQLLDQSEDLRQIKNEWRRFWFNDQPSQLTPGRVHGGIN